MSYHTDMEKWKESPVFAVKNWRNMPQETEETLENFLFWLGYDREEETSLFEFENIRALIDEYLGRDLKKIKQGEQELMQAWIKACKKETK